MANKELAQSDITPSSLSCYAFLTSYAYSWGSKWHISSLDTLAPEDWNTIPEHDLYNSPYRFFVRHLVIKSVFHYRKAFVSTFHFDFVAPHIRNWQVALNSHVMVGKKNTAGTLVWLAPPICWLNSRMVQCHRCCRFLYVEEGRTLYRRNRWAKIKEQMRGRGGWTFRVVGNWRCNRTPLFTYAVRLYVFCRDFRMIRKNWIFSVVFHFACVVAINVSVPFPFGKSQIWDHVSLALLRWNEARYTIINVEQTEDPFGVPFSPILLSGILETLCVRVEKYTRCRSIWLIRSCFSVFELTVRKECPSKNEQVRTRFCHHMQLGIEKM